MKGMEAAPNSAYGPATKPGSTGRSSPQLPPRFRPLPSPPLNATVAALQAAAINHRPRGRGRGIRRASASGQVKALSSPSRRAGTLGVEQVGAWASS